LYICLSVQRKEKANLGLEFLNGLFYYISETITNEDFIKECRRHSCAFVRSRKLSFQNLLVTLLSLTRTGVQLQLDRILSQISQQEGKVVTMSKSAFTQSRSKLSELAFVQLNTKLLSFFEENAPLKRNWKGFSPVAIDGSRVNLPNVKELIDHFGVHRNQMETANAAARISFAYDICNRLVLEASIKNISVGEQSMAREHLAKLDPQRHLLVLDRGYPSIQLAKELNDKGFKFCFRLSSAWKEPYRLLTGREDVQWHLPKGRRYKENGKEHYLSEDLSLRIVQVTLANGAKEVLLTNLLDRVNYTNDDLRMLYAMRWEIEECYKRFKQVAQIEYFSGRTILAIKQDFFARIFMLNITSLIETQKLQPELDQSAKTENKFKKQVNRTLIYSKVKELLYPLLVQHQANVLHLIMPYLSLCHDVIRPNRKFPRPKCFKHRGKQLKYKAA
jgi:Transposase DDE domain